MSRRRFVNSIFVLGVNSESTKHRSLIQVLNTCFCGRSLGVVLTKLFWSLLQLAEVVL